MKWSGNKIVTAIRLKYHKPEDMWKFNLQVFNENISITVEREMALYEIQSKIDFALKIGVSPWNDIAVYIFLHFFNSTATLFSRVGFRYLWDMKFSTHFADGKMFETNVSKLSKLILSTALQRIHSYGLTSSPKRNVIWYEFAQMVVLIFLFLRVIYFVDKNLKFLTASTNFI